MYADFRIATPLEKVQEFIKGDKNGWIEAFAEFDQSCIYRVTVDEFTNALQVFFKFRLRK